MSHSIQPAIRRRRRRGVTIAESSMALLVVGLCASLIGELAWTAASQRRAVERRMVASQEIANLGDELRQWPWEDLTAERTARLQLSPLASATLPEAALSVSIVEETEPRPAKRLDVRVAWGGDGDTSQSLEYSTWRFAP